jgi:hypothetical protein
MVNTHPPPIPWHRLRRPTDRNVLYLWILTHHNMRRCQDMTQTKLFRGKWEAVERDVASLLRSSSLDPPAST